MKNILIVESKNDKDFVEALIRHIDLEDTNVSEPICQIDDFECMGGLNPTKLKDALRDKREDVIKGKIQRIGILIDQDKETTAQRLKLVSDCAAKAFGVSVRLNAINTFETIEFDDTSVELVCHFTNVDEEGELETVLKAIKNQDAVYADCLEAWKQCLESKGKTISTKEFDKFWVSNYIRFDTCTNRQKKQAERKCSMQNFDYILEKKNIFDLDHSLLNELREFLSLFKAV